jgi:hypothetical protein
MVIQTRSEEREPRPPGPSRGGRRKPNPLVGTYLHLGT